MACSITVHAIASAQILESPQFDNDAAATVAALHAALSAAAAKLPPLGLDLDSSLFVHLYLADMSHFAAANQAYCQHLPSVSPPSRACVQVCGIQQTHYFAVACVQVLVSYCTSTITNQHCYVCLLGLLG